MEDGNVWIAATKSRALPGCGVDMDGCEFYFADVYVVLSEEAGPTAVASVVEQVRQALAGKQLELAEVSLCARFVPEEWLDQTGSIESMHELANKARVFVCDLIQSVLIEASGGQSCLTQMLSIISIRSGASICRLLRCNSWQ